MTIHGASDKTTTFIPSIQMCFYDSIHTNTFYLIHYALMQAIMRI